MAMSVAVKVELPYVGKPYNKQPGESDLWFTRFQTYVTLGPERSITKAIHASNSPLTGIRNWEEACTKGRWVERAAFYDQEKAIEFREKMEDERLDMLKRHANQARNAGDLCMRVIERALELCDESSGGLKTVGLVPRTITKENPETGDIVKVRSEGLLPLLSALTGSLAKLQQAERLALGEPNPAQQLEISGQIQNPSSISDEEVDNIINRLKSVVATRYENGTDFPQIEETESKEGDR